MPETPTQFIDCERLKTEPHVDTVRYQQFFLLRRKSLAGRDMPAIHPGRYARRRRRGRSMDNRAALATLRAGLKTNRLEGIDAATVRSVWEDLLRGGPPPDDTDPRADRKPGRLDEAALRELLDRPDLRRPGRFTIATPQMLHARSIGTPAAALPSFAGTLIRRTGDNVVDVALRLLTGLDLTPIAPGQDSPTDAVWALGVRYAQHWASEGYLRGRLLRSVALPAGASTEIVVKTWRKSTERRETVQSVDHDVSTEIVGDESWSLAVTKAVSNTLKTGVNGNLKGDVDVSVPVKAAQVGGGAEAGIGGNVDNSLETSLTETEEQLRKTTATQADRLKKASSSTVEIAGESGHETTSTTRIENPNRCHTLNYHFFAVTERYSVTTATEEVHPYLLVPLTLPTVTKAWLLCHECTLKPLLPCDTYYQGFEAAKILLAREKLGLPTAGMDEETVRQAASGLESEIQAALTAFGRLANARLDTVGEMGGDEGGAAGIVGAVGGAIGNGLDAAADAAGAAGDLAGAAYDAMVDLYEGATGLVADGVAAVGGFLGLARTAAPPGAVFQMSLDAGAGGPGSWLWWAVAGEVAPELARAYETLQGRFAAVQGMAEGAPRNRAIIEAATAFFTELGDVDALFRKVNTAIAVVTAVAAAGGMVAAGAIVATAMALGGAVVGAIVAASGGLAAIAALVAPLMADVVPDDEGLETAVNVLRGRYDQAQALALMPPPVPDAAGEESRLTHQQAAAEAKRQQMELALQEVEHERLVCHVNDHLLLYMQAIWAEMDETEIRDRLLTLGIEPGLFELRFDGFVGHRGALRLSNVGALAQQGFDWAKQARVLRLEAFYARDRAPFVTDLPTEGVVAEAALGQCSGCDDFVMRHRDLDLRDKVEEVKAKELANTARELENQRRQARLAASQLDDPSPYGAADELNVHLHDDEPDDDG